MKTTKYCTATASLVSSLLLLSSGAVAQSPTASAADAAPKTASAPKADARVPRVFVAKIQAGEGANEGEASLLNDAFLVAIEKFEGQFEIRTSQDIEGIAKLEVAQTLAGCDVVSCAAEIGDALGADQLVTGQLGRVGETWILSLTRTERSTLKSVSRTQVRAIGAAPDVLFPMIDKQAADLFGQAPGRVDEAAANAGPSMPLLIGGGAGIGLAVVAAGAAGALYYFSQEANNGASDATTKADFDAATNLSRGLYFGFAGAALGAAVLAVGGLGGLAASFLVGDSE